MKCKICFKSIALLTLSSFLFLSIAFSQRIFASDASIDINADATDIVVGQTVTVSVTLKNSNDIAYAEFLVNYDSSVLQYQSGDSDASNPDGVVPFTVVGGSKEQLVYDFSMTFKALKTGTCDFTVVGSSFLDGDAEPFSPSLGSASVKVWAEGSDDATLKSLKVGEYSLSPSFSSGTTDYTVYVNSETASVAVTATPSQDGGRVDTSGADISDLAYGNNVYKITCYAPRGNSKTYTVTIVRPEPEPETEEPTQPVTETPNPTSEASSEAASTEPAVTETDTEEETDETVQILTVDLDEITYYITDVFEESEIPANFGRADVDYKGTTIGGLHSDALGVDLLYLIPKDMSAENSDSSELGAFYLYDADKDNLYPFRKISAGGVDYILLNPANAESEPAGLQEADATINDISVEGFMEDADAEYVFFYALNAEGQPNWYSYDIVEKTVQRRTLTESEEESTADSADLLELKNEIASLQDENQSLQNSNKTISNFRNIIIAAAAAMILILLALLIYLFVRETQRKQKEKKAEDEILQDLDIEDIGDEEFDYDDIGEEDGEKDSGIDADAEDYGDDAEDDSPASKK